MIGKISIGKSFRGCILYCMSDKKQQMNESSAMINRADILKYNLCFGSKFELIKQFGEVRNLNPKLSNPVMHISLSFAPEDKIEKWKMSEMVEECSRKMGFEKNQYLAVYHRDTRHQHLHIVVNRVGFDGKTLSDSHNFAKIAAYCRQMEQKYQLREVVSPRRFLSEEQRWAPRHDIRKKLLKENIKYCISRSKGYFDFKDKMEQLGYKVIRGRGIAFQDNQKVYFKGSEVGYSLATIENILNPKTIFTQDAMHMQKKRLTRGRSLEKENLFRENQLKKLQGQKSNADITEGKSQDQQQQILEILMRPVEDKEEIPFELRKSKRGKRRRH